VIDGREQRLEPRVVAYWLVSGVVMAAVSFVLMAGLGYFLAQRFGVSDTVVRWGATVVAVLLAVWALVPPPLAYQRWRFSVDSELLRMSSGIVFLEQKSIPVSRLQHVDLLRGPIERMFGLATLVIWTAGNEGAAFRVPGLGAERAARLRDAILAARGDDVV
jgi:membrane protein YdbS with pleckstrin-like domain